MAEEPAALDSKLVGAHIFMRWETYGWQLGKITAVITKDTPRLFKSQLSLPVGRRHEGPGQAWR